MLTADARAQTVRATDPLSLLRALQGAGTGACLTTDGDPRVRASSDGVNWSIYVYGCTSHADCTSVQSSAGFDMTSPPDVAAHSEWIRTRQFGTAFAAPDGDPFLQWGVNLDGGGVSEVDSLDSVGLWAASLAAFTDHTGWE